MLSHSENILRSRSGFQSALAGINVAVVGILNAALYNPVWTSAIKTPYDFCLALISFGLFMKWKLPSWIVVIVFALGGIVIFPLV